MNSGQRTASRVTYSSGDSTVLLAISGLDFAPMYLMSQAPFLHDICMIVFPDMPSISVNVYLYVYSRFT